MGIRPSSPPRAPLPARTFSEASVRASLCYAIPLVPALGALLRREEEPYVRLHAARALIFFGLVALAQCGLLVFLLVGGSFARDVSVGALLGLCFFALVAVQAVVTVRIWRGLLAAALLGANPLAGRLGPATAQVEAWSQRGVAYARARWAQFTAQFHPLGASRYNREYQRDVAAVARPRRRRRTPAR